MNALSASTIIVSILTAIGIAPGPVSMAASSAATIPVTAARAAIVPATAILAADGRPVVFRQV